MARPNPRCALCGAPTRPQTVGGVQSLVCVACGAATVDQRALEQLVAARSTPPPREPSGPIPGGGPAVGSLDPDAPTREEPAFHLDGLAALAEADFAGELEHLRAQRRRQVALLAAMAGLVVIFLVATPVLVVVAGAMVAASQVATAPAPAPVDPPPLLAPAPEAPSPVPAPSEPAAPEPVPPGSTPAPDGAAPAPAPPPVPAPADPPAPPAPASTDQAYSSLVAAGWKVASRQPADGEQKFQQALRLKPNASDALYGLGYCLLKQGRLAEARDPLCRARVSANAETLRDVDALLANNGLTCSH